MFWIDPDDIVLGKSLDDVVLPDIEDSQSQLVTPDSSLRPHLAQDVVACSMSACGSATISKTIRKATIQGSFCPSSMRLRPESGRRQLRR
jgi:hypothetical protein